MKKYVIALICFYISSSSFAQTISYQSFASTDKMTVAGQQLLIVDRNCGDYPCKSLLVNGKYFTNFGDIDIYVALEYVFKVDDDHLVLISRSSGGTGCASQYELVKVTPDGKVSKIKTKDEPFGFGNCSDIPKVAVEKSKLTFSFPRQKGKSIAIYQNGHLTEKD
jgi:hypothetical protein